jgi:hypothetical protein
MENELIFFLIEDDISCLFEMEDELNLFFKWTMTLKFMLIEENLIFTKWTWLQLGTILMQGWIFYETSADAQQRLRPTLYMVLTPIISA